MRKNLNLKKRMNIRRFRITVGLTGPTLANLRKMARLGCTTLTAIVSEGLFNEFLKTHPRQRWIDQKFKGCILEHPHDGDCIGKRGQSLYR